jgi:two-component system sensor histidine kinase MtrB
MRSGRFSQVHLRTLLLAFTALLGVLVVAAAASIVRTSMVVSRSVRAAEELTEQITRTHELERILREHQRLGNLQAATGDPRVAEMRAQLAADLFASSREVDLGSDEPEAPPEIAQMKADIASYLAERDALFRRQLPLADYLAGVRPSIERALSSVAAVRRHQERTLRRARADARRALEVQRAVAVISAFLVLCGLAAVSLGASRLVVRPLLALDAAVHRFRRGDTDVSVALGRVTEVADLAGSFNEMVEMIVRQRREQLTFLAGVAHDMRNPLAVLKAGVEALVLAPSTITPERLARIDRQVDGLSRMVGDLLDAARIEAGNLALELEDVDLRDTARSMVDLYAATTSAHELVILAGVDPVIVHGDPLRLEQVIGNLLSNAIKYSPSGGRVEVSVAMEEGWAVLTIADEGLGIPPAEIPTLFLPFRRHALTRELVPGVGLGLSITRRIVEAHGGHIDVQSAPGAGSVFRVRLPLAHSTEAAQGADEITLQGRELEPLT